MEEELEISRETICKILAEGLRKREICSRFVPHCMTDVKKALRLQAYQELIQPGNDDLSLFDSVATGDDMWCFQYDLEIKKQNME
jgi:hypothetical protein